jgi:uncharacterized protein
MKQIVLSKSQARKIVLHAAGLAKRGQFGKGPGAVNKLFNHVGFVQIDTIYVVERAHHHAIAARVPDYRIEWLERLQADGKIFEFWTYATGFMPMDHFRFSLPVKESFLARRKPLTPIETNLMNTILNKVSREGPVRARDFENDRVTKSSGWWDWRPSKIALERLHLEGRLMTLRGKDFEKMYDLTENIVPPGIDTTRPSDEDYAQHIIRTSLKALGLGSLKDIAFRSRYVKHSVKTELQKLVDAGEVCTVSVKGLNGTPLYMLSDYQSKKISITGDAFVLSPFDVLNVLRHRLKNLFDFDYQVECFVPAPKRKYGYFSLPILVGEVFVGRMDAKADRKQRRLTIHNLHMEPIKITKSMVLKTAQAIRDFANFNGCESITIAKCNDKTVLKYCSGSICK